MIKEFGEIKKENSLLSIILIFLPLLLFGTFYPIDLIRNTNDIALIVLSLFSLGYFAFSKNLKISFTYVDAAWGILLSWMFLSYFWATDPSIALYFSFGWLIIYLYFLLIKSTELGPNTQKGLMKLFSLFFLFLLLNVLYVVAKGQALPDSNLGLHRNLVCVYLVGLFPFFLYLGRNGKWSKLSKISFAFLLALSLFLVGCRGALIALVMLLFYFELFRGTKLSKTKVGIFIATVLLFILLVSFFPTLRNSLLNLPIVQKFFEANEFDRFYMFRNSIWLFLESPLTGVGLDNWKLEAFKKGYEDFSYAQNVMGFRTQYVHNIYGKFISEIGLIGFSAFLFIFLYPLRFFYRNRYNLSAFERACSGTLIVFLVVGLFYSMIVIKRGFLNPFFLITVFALSQVVKADRILLSPRGEKKVRVILVILSSLCLSFLILNCASEMAYKSMISSVRAPKVYFEKFEKAFTPQFKTYYRQRSILPMVASYAAQKDSTSRAGLYYLQSLEYDPYNVDLLLESANYLFEYEQDYTRAEELGLRAYRIHKKYYKTNLLMSRIEFQKGNYESALEYLFFIESLEERLNFLLERKAKFKERSFGKQIETLINESASLLRDARQLKKRIERRRIRIEN